MQANFTSIVLFGGKRTLINRSTIWYKQHEKSLIDLKEKNTNKSILWSDE